MGNKEFFLKIKDPTLGTKPKPKVTPEELKKMVEKHRNEPKMSVEDLKRMANKMGAKVFKKGDSLESMLNNSVKPEKKL